MIYITGDTHGLYDFAKLELFAEENFNLSKADYMIIAGDFGGVWNARTLEKDLAPYEKLPFTVLFVDGNHENFNLLESYQIDFWQGGKVHYIKPSIIHLMRGQVYELDGKTIFTFGGGTSIDKHLRKEGESWWSQEIPTYSELDEAILNLKKYNNKIDYIITHSIDEKALYYPPLRQGGYVMSSFAENKMLSYFEETVDYKHWYFGHYHMDGNLTETKTALYHDIIKI